MKYLIPIPDQLSGEDMVDSEELAVALGHANEDAATELLEVRDTTNCEDYVLRLCGTVRLKDSQGFVHHATDMTVSRFRELRDGCEFLANSWFEWIRASGDAVLEPMETICTDAPQEVGLFAELLEVDAAALEAKTCAPIPAVKVAE
jgi:hypothetical protein